MQRIDLKRFDAETTVSFDARNGSEAAGLILHAMLSSNLTLSLTRTATGKVIELASFTNTTNRNDSIGAARTVWAAVPFDPPSGARVHLKVSFDGHENASFFFSADGCTWKPVGDPINVGLDGQVDLSWRLQAWSGATIGLFAVKKDAAAESYADFDAFTVTNLE